jgi:hypothetical protein
LRLEITDEHLDQYMKLIQEYAPLIPTELLFNIDESGLSDWKERKPKGVLISPLLFNLCIEPLLQVITKECGDVGVQIGRAGDQVQLAVRHMQMT